MASQSQAIQTFKATLTQPLNFGHILEICGKAQQDANRISLSFGHLNNNNTDLQILLDFTKRQILFTQFQTKNNNIVLTKDLILAEFLNEFKFYIMLGESKFHVALNSKPLINFNYTHNLAKLQIQSVEITGRIKYLKQLDHRKYFPQIWPPIQIADEYLDFSNEQPVPFEPGHIIIIRAQLEGNSKGRFIIQFRHARDNKRQELHVSVRFDTNKIVRNSKCRRQSDDKLTFNDEEVDGFIFIFSRFGQEEVDNDEDFPFLDFYKPFKLVVAFCETEFRLAKDGKFLFNFSYRSPDMLRQIIGPKIFGTNGVNVKVWGIEHVFLEDLRCLDFEKFSM